MKLEQQKVYEDTINNLKISEIIKMHGGEQENLNLPVLQGICGQQHIHVNLLKTFHRSTAQLPATKEVIC